MKSAPNVKQGKPHSISVSEARTSPYAMSRIYPQPTPTERHRSNPFRLWKNWNSRTNATRKFQSKRPLKIPRSRFWKWMLPKPSLVRMKTKWCISSCCPYLRKEHYKAVGIEKEEGYPYLTDEDKSTSSPTSQARRKPLSAGIF